MTKQEEMPWPKKDTEVFAAGENDRTNVILSWLDMTFEDRDFIIADGFKIVADRAVKALEGGEEHGHADMYFFPVAYLYRHYLELAMKCIYRSACHLLDKETKPEVITAHNLHKLWNETKDVLSKCFPESPSSTLDDVERIILQFHKLDPSGQCFRYAKDKKDKPHLTKAPESIDLTNLKNIMDGIGNFFSGCDCGLSERTEYQDDYRGEY